MCSTPIVLITYKRPETTRRVLERIAAVRPTRLYVAGDGPRTDGEREAVLATRRLFDRLDWPCEVERDFSEDNLGLALRVTTAVTRAFERFDELIVLEDDTVPDPTFFRFCDELLERYRADDRVLQIKGTCNVPVSDVGGSSSYVFTQLASPWGWATWKRAWQGFDCSFFASDEARRLRAGRRRRRARWRTWPKVGRNSSLRERVERCGKYYSIWMRGCDTRTLTDSWAGAFAFSVVERDGLVASPRVNLVSNIGFGSDGVHFRDADHAMSGSEVQPMRFPLCHPEVVQTDPGFQRRSARATDRAFLGRVPLDDKLLAARRRRTAGGIAIRQRPPTAGDGSAAPLSLSVIIEWENVKLSELERARAMFAALLPQFRQLGGNGGGDGPAIRPDVELIVGYDAGAFEPEQVKKVVESMMPASEPSWPVRYVAGSEVDYYQVKNLGGWAASGDLLCFLDSDVVPEPGWLREILAPFANPEVQLVGGHTYVDPHGIVAKAFALAWFFPLRESARHCTPGTDFFANNVAFRKSLFDRYPFPRQFGTSRGACRNLAELLDRHGVAGVRTSAAQVAHPPPNGIAHLFTRGLVQGRDFYLQRVQDAYHVFFGVPLLDTGILIAGQGLRGVGRIARLRREVGLSFAGLPLAVGIWGAFTAAQLLGLALERVRPGLIARRVAG